MDGLNLQAEPSYITRRVLRYVENDRMAGKVAVWDTVKELSPKMSAMSGVGAQDQVVAALETAVQSGAAYVQADVQTPSDFASALAHSLSDYTRAPQQSIEAEALEAEEQFEHENAPELEDQSGAAQVYDEDDAQSFGFDDLVDLINPLQHIPLVNQIYREVTGDQIKAPMRMIGGALFSGGAGVIAPLIDSVVHAETGKSLQEQIVARVFSRDNSAAQAFASNAPEEEEQNAVLALANLSADVGFTPRDHRVNSAYND